MNKKELIEKVKKGGYTPDNLVSWINSLQFDSKVTTEDHKAGDFLMHHIFKHPYLILKKNKDNSYICTLLTTDDNYPDIIEPCKSRFLSGSYITKTLFKVSEIKGGFMGVYDNNAHLREVLIKLKVLFK